MATRMKAAQFIEPGAPLHVAETTVPRIGKDDVLIKVRASAAIPNMRAVLSGKEWFRLPPLPCYFGLDTSGTIEAVGANVQSFEPGDPVYVNPALSCGTCGACILGRPLYCSAFALRSYFGTSPGSDLLHAAYPYGGFSEFITAPPNALVRLPNNVSFASGARFGYLGSSYAALQGAGVKSGSFVIVNGATGTLGVGATLLALAMGATRILATGRNTAILQQLVKLAPDRIVTYRLGSGDLSACIRDFTDGLGADAFVDCQGNGAPIEATRDCIFGLRKGGHAVLIGFVHAELSINYGWFLRTAITITGSSWFTLAQAIEMAEMARVGTLRLELIESRAYSLDDVNVALADAAQRPGGFTNIIVDPTMPTATDDKGTSMN